MWGARVAGRVGAASRTMDRGCIEDRKSETDGVYHPVAAVPKPARDSPCAGGEATRNGVACMLLLLLLLCALMIARVCGCVDGEMAGDTESTIAELLSSLCCVRDRWSGPTLLQSASRNFSTLRWIQTVRVSDYAIQTVRRWLARPLFKGLTKPAPRPRPLSRLPRA